LAPPSIALFASPVAPAAQPLTHFPLGPHPTLSLADRGTAYLALGRGGLSAFCCDSTFP
jgi:hypothetical protein